MLHISTIEFTNGEIYQANIKARGVDDAHNKTGRIAARLERDGRKVQRFTTDHSATLPGREFMRVSRGHCRGTVYRVDLGAAIIKRLR